MADTNAADEPIFRAMLRPYRSLGRTGFRFLMGALTLGWVATGVFFLVDGAWPVVIFLVLEATAIYAAFRLNYRAARAREEVSLSRTCLDILKVAPSGRSESHRFNPFWARFSVKRHDEIGITGMAVHARGQTVPLGAFLNPDDKESFAKAFGRALRMARNW